MALLSFQPSARGIPPVPILVEENALARLGDILGENAVYDVTAILYDAAVKDRAQVFAASWKNAVLVEVPSGEKSKSLAETERIVRALLEARVSRKSLIVAIGGGMLTDLAGFVASIYMRGLDFVLAPTSFLAMTDAAIGGKTGVDIGTLKNIIGTFAHPHAVICDIAALATLPEAGLAEGLVEVIKMAAILDAKIFGWMEKNIDAVLRRDPAALTLCIEHAVTMKMAVVEDDERERTGRRILLNFGHTVGHAIEALSDFKLSHGKAVSIGMAVEMTVAGTKDAKRVLSLLEKIHMPTAFPKTHGNMEVWKAMQSDKKNSQGFVRIAVPVMVGRGEVQELSQDAFFRAIA